MQEPLHPPLNLGSKTQWGRIVMVGTTGGERYYWIRSRGGAIAMLPWFVVEAS